MPLKRIRIWQYLVAVGIVAVAYFATASFAISNIGLDKAATPVWPPSGIALAALLLRGYRLWPGIVLGDFLLVQSFGGAWPNAAVSALGSLLEALAAAWLLRRAGFRPSLDRLKDVWSFIILAVLLAPVVNASLSVLLESDFQLMVSSKVWESWWTLWLGDSMGILVVTPVLLIWQKWLSFSKKRQRLIEAAIWLALLTSLSWIVFGSKTSWMLAQLPATVARYPLEYLPFPLVVWAAVRFGQRGAVVGSLVVSSIAIWGAAQGGGPFFVKAESIDQAILFLQAFMGVITITALVLAAAVTERQEAEVRLRKSEAQLRTVTETAASAILVHQGGQICYANPAAMILFGCEQEEILQKNFWELVHPDYRALVKERGMARIQGENVPSRYELKVLTRTGEERWVDFTAALIDFEGKPAGLGTGYDITERKQAEARLQQQAACDRLLNEISLRIRQSLDLDQILNTTVVEVQQFLQADRVYIGHVDAKGQGFILAESVESGFPAVSSLVLNQPVVQEFRDLFEPGLSRVIDDMSQHSFPPIISQFLQQFQVKASLSVPILFGKGLWVLVANQCTQTRHWQKFEVDLLEQLANQVAIAVQQAQLYQQVQALNATLESQVEDRTAQLQQKMEELQALNQFKDLILHAFSHDLRTSIMGMSLIFKNLRNKAGDSVSLNRSILERVVQSNERQLELINSLLADQSNEGRKILLHYEPVQLDALIQSVIQDLKPRLSQNQASLVTWIANNLPCINADPLQLRRVFENLLDNALRHNCPGVTLTLSATIEDSVIRCTLEDNGVGMSPAQCSSLFKLYVRGVHNPHLTGIGLGLYICHQVVSAHGGQIGVMSTPEVGSKFWFTLPLPAAIATDSPTDTSATISA